MDIVLKTCAKCALPKPLEQFVKDNRRPDGHGYRCLVCAALSKVEHSSTPGAKAKKAVVDRQYRADNHCKIALQKAQRRQDGMNIINSYKDKPCQDCNILYPTYCMELDHVSGDKVLNVSSMKLMSRIKLVAEIGKCEVVCAICHRIRTANRRPTSKDKRLLAHRAMINDYKSKPCCDCHKCYLSVAMDLDHVVGEKLLEISNMGHYPRWKVIEELSKCEVVCANCHRIRTESRRLLAMA